jgi:hypothetical protein
MELQVRMEIMEEILVQQIMDGTLIVVGSVILQECQVRMEAMARVEDMVPTELRELQDGYLS